MRQRAFLDARMPFPVRYYIFAMLFVIFDIEVIFLYPWAVVFGQIGLFGLVEMLVFIALFRGLRCMPGARELLNGIDLCSTLTANRRRPSNV